MTLALMLAAGTILAASPAIAEDVETTRIEVVVPEPAAAAEQATVQIAILLDTSNSMDGLIDQAKRELWSIVNELALARHDGQRPLLQIALYEYGNNGLSVENGYVRQVQPLTDNLDQISQDLFALTTNGGDEYCGQVIGAAVNQLEWSDATDDLKAIFIAGNEPFTQGSVNWEEACSAAIERGIVVNTIFCGPEAQGISTGWQGGALRSDGMFTHIDQNQEVIHVAAPQDEEITRLGVELNSTYIPYGHEGAENWARQSAMDATAAEESESVNVQRQACKASGMYLNSGWDLVDACANGVELAEVKEEDLPEEMQAMSEEERAAHVQEHATRRAELQTRIQELTAERRVFVEAERQRIRDEEGDSLDSAIVSIIRRLAERMNYEFE